VRLGNMDAVSSEAAVYHVSAVAAQLEARDSRIGETSGKPGGLGSWGHKLPVAALATP
jgi:hypothetical protein